MSNIVFYGADWCGDCVRAKAHLNANEIEFDFIDVDQHSEAAALVESINNGKRIIPTIIIDGKSYTNPDNTTLNLVLNIDAPAFHPAEDSCGIDASVNHCGDACEF